MIATGPTGADPRGMEAVVVPSPSGIMFADQIRIEGLRVLSAHHIEKCHPCIKSVQGIAVPA